MICLDVNVLVYAHREDAPRHAEYRSWLESGLNGDELFGVTSLVLTGFVRVVTHPRVFDPPSPLDVALTFAEEIRGHDNCMPVEPGERYWDLFTALCRAGDARGNLVTDAHIAAVARESGAVLATTDGDFSRFDGLRRTHPLTEG